MRKPRTTNPELLKLIRSLKKQGREHNAEIWRDTAERLAKPSRRRITVNLSRLNRHTEKSDTVVVPGKVLGAGEISHPVTVGAAAFSAKARQKITVARGKCLSLEDLVQKNPKGSGVKIIG